jgi:hypothetical protein
VTWPTNPGDGATEAKIMLMIDESDSRTLKNIYEATDFSSPELIPWVRVGNLYLSITETGNLAWPPVIVHLYGKGHRNFRVFSGRHGTPSGGFALDSKIPQNVVDHSHFNQDKDVALYLRTGRREGLMKNPEIPSKNFASEPINITVENYGAGSRDELKEAAKTYLDKGDTVIFAWCFSITSMYLYNTDKNALQIASMQTNFNKAVKTVVKEKYEWSKRSVNQVY